MRKALLIVDVQNDFCEGGALAVKGGAEVAWKITKYLEGHADTYELIIASKDYHSGEGDNGGHFSDTPDYVNTWPPHCVANTWGSDFHRNLVLAVTPPRVFVYKGYDTPAYSAFEGATRWDVTTGDLLRKYAIEQVDVVGIATDYCVKATALDAVKLGFKTRVLADLTAGVDPATTGEALMVMIQQHVTLEGGLTPFPYDLLYLVTGGI